MNIAFSGPHRVGKTTLAKLLAKKLGIPFCPTNVSADPFWKAYDLKPDGTYDFETRLFIQNEIYHYLAKRYYQFSEAHDSWITDRALIDVIAYTLCNIDETSASLQGQIDTLVHDCHVCDGLYIDNLVVIKPGIDIVPEPGKQNEFYLSKWYIDTLYYTIIGKLFDNPYYVQDVNYSIFHNNKTPEEVVDQIEFWLDNQGQ